MSNERFSLILDYDDEIGLQDNLTDDVLVALVKHDTNILGFFIQVLNLLNRLDDEKEYWKGNACNEVSLTQILYNELHIAQEQGYEPSDAFKNFIKSKQEDKKDDRETI